MIDKKICIFGLGYVGLPLAELFSRKGYEIVGYDINAKRIFDLNQGIDTTGSFSQEDISALSPKGIFTNELKQCEDATVYIVTVPTPLDGSLPNLDQLSKACKMIGKCLKKEDLIIFESTVWPGCTEEVCVPILAKESGLVFNQEFFVGYSPERINPGETSRKLEDIIKITSGSNPETAKKVDELYQSILTVETYPAESIKIAEAAKIVENAQRDINIAFMNEISMILNRMNIDTYDVIKAASTKWNFLPFVPGLVGGHCISVDPFYLSHKAESVGYSPEIILSGRRVNDGMGKEVAIRIVKQILDKGLTVKNNKVLILGFTFKENCVDIRNTKVFSLYNELKDFGCSVAVYDPVASSEKIEEEYQITTTKDPDFSHYQTIILAVPHQEFLNMNWESINLKQTIVFDLKAILPKKFVTQRL